MAYKMHVKKRSAVFILILMILSPQADFCRCAIAQDDIRKVVAVRFFGDDLEAVASFKKVKSIRAELYNNSGILDDLASVEAFNIPPEFWPVVLAYFAEPVLDEEPRPRWKEIGTLQIRFEAGDVRTILFYQSGKGNLSFSIGGMRCISGRPGNTNIDHSLTLDGIIRRAHASISRR